MVKRIEVEISLTEVVAFRYPNLCILTKLLEAGIPMIGTVTLPDICNTSVSEGELSWLDSWEINTRTYTWTEGVK